MIIQLAPGETNFIGSRPLTQAEADQLYFPLNGDLGSASFGVSTTEMNAAIASAVEGLLTRDQADALYLSSFDDLFQELEADYQASLNQQIQVFGDNLIQLVNWENLANKPDFDSMYRKITDSIEWSDLINIPSLVTSWESITDKPTKFPPESHWHYWGALSNPPETATRWPLWTEVGDKPATFPPETHTHDWSAITSKPATFPPATHTHDWSAIANPPLTATRWPLWEEVTSKPTTFTPSSHTHDWSQITNPPSFSADWPAITNKPISFYENVYSASETIYEMEIISSERGVIGRLNWRTDNNFIGLTLEATSPYYYGVDTGTYFKWQLGLPGYGSQGVLTYGIIPYDRTRGVAKATEDSIVYSYGSGWAQYSPTFAASYRRLDKLVVLSGLVTRTTTSGALIATLPTGYRPPVTRLFGCQSSQGYTRIDINSSGQILLTSPNPAATIGWISLDGISFFAA